jgi:O-antigen ligase
MAKKKKRRPNNQTKSVDPVMASSNRLIGAKQPPKNHPTASIPDTIILYCVYALVGLLPLAFVYQTYDIFELTKLTVLRLITLAMLGAWSWRIFKARAIRVARTPIDWFVLAYLAVFTLATILSKNPTLSLLGEYGRFEGLLAILNYGAIFLLTGSLLRDNSAIRDRAAFLRSLVFTAIAAADIMSLYGIFQRFGLDFLTWSGAGTDLSRAFSTLGNPIYVAAYLTIILSLALAVFVAEQALWPRVFLGASASLMFASLVFTFSRAGWAGFLLSLVVLIALFFVMWARRRRSTRGQWASVKNALPAIVLIAVIVLVAAVSLTISSRVASSPTKSAIQRALSSFDLSSPGVRERLFLWESAAQMVKDRPVLGWGPETFGTYYPKYRLKEYVRYEIDVIGRPRPLFQNRVHSDILQTGVSAGVLGMLAYVALWAGFFFFAIRKLLKNSSSPPPFDTALLVGIIAGLAGYLLQAQFSFSTIAVSSIVWALMAVTFVIGPDNPISSSEETSQSLSKSRDLNLNFISRPLLIAGEIFLLILISFAAISSVRQLVADYYFDQGVYAVEALDASLAEETFNRALAFNPYEAEYAAYAANSFTDIAKKAGNAAGAKSYLSKSIDYENQAISLNPDMPSYRYNLGNAFYYYAMLPGLDKAESKLRYEKALDEFLLSVAWDPVNADARLNLASAYLALGRKNDAIPEIQQALVVNPGLTNAKTWLDSLQGNNTK